MSTILGSIYRVSPRRLVWPYSATRSLFIYDDCLVVGFHSRRAGLGMMLSAEPNDPSLGSSGGFGGADVRRARSEIAQTHHERDLTPEELASQNTRNRMIRLDDVAHAELDQRRTRALVGDVSDRLILALQDGTKVVMWWPARLKRREIARQALLQAFGERLTLRA